MKKNFIDFFVGTIKNISYDDKNSSLYMRCSLGGEKHIKNREIKTDANNFYLLENSYFKYKNCQALFVLSCFSKTDTDVVAIYMPSQDKFYHFLDNKLYSKEELFEMYRLEKIQAISKEITKLSTRIAEISSMEVPELKEFN